jgi:hypothetical protein
MENPTVLKKNIDILLIKCCINNFSDLFQNTFIKFIMPYLYNRHYNDCIHRYLIICYIKGSIRIIQIIYDLIPKLKNIDEQTKIHLLYRIFSGGNTDSFKFFFNLCHDKNIDITVDDIKSLNNNIIYNTVRKNHLDLFKVFFNKFPEIFNDDSLVKEIVKEIFNICCHRKYKSFIDYLITINLHTKLTNEDKEECFKKAFFNKSIHIIRTLLENINYTNEIETLFDFVISNTNNILYSKSIIKILANYISINNHPRKDDIFYRVITKFPDFLIE